MSSVLDKAQNFNGGVIAAARQRERWLRQAANTGNEEEADLLREAAADLAARYPDIEDLEPGEAERFARERGHGKGSRSPVHEGRQRPGRPTSTRTQPKPKASPTPRPAPRRSPAPRARQRPARPPTPRVDRAIAQTGIPAATSSIGASLMALLGATVALAAFYLLIAPPKNAALKPPQIAKGIEGVKNAVGRFLSTESDVFPANGAKHFTVTATNRNTGQVIHPRFEGRSTIEEAARRLEGTTPNTKGHR